MARPPPLAWLALIVVYVVLFLALHPAWLPFAWFIAACIIACMRLPKQVYFLIPACISFALVGFFNHEEIFWPIGGGIFGIWLVFNLVRFAFGAAPIPQKQGVAMIFVNFNRFLLSSLWGWKLPSRSKSLGNLQTWKRKENGLEFELDSGCKALIEACDDRVLRIRASSGNFLSNEPNMVIKYDWKPKFLVEENKREISIHTKNLRLRFKKRPFRLSFEDVKGSKILREDERGLKAGKKSMLEHFETARGEGFYGLGEKLGKLDKRGKKLVLATREHAGDFSASLEDRTPYKNVPFFMSTRGYGIFLHSSSRSVWRFGEDRYSFEVGGPELDYYFIYGPTPKQVLEEYTELTGRPPMPPRWTLGYWHSSSRAGGYTQRQLIKICRELHEEGVPCSVANLDPIWQARYNDLKWRKRTHPKPKKLIEELRKLGTRLCLWETPFCNEFDSLSYREGRRKNFFATRKGGLDPYRAYWWMGYGGLVDFSNPKASDWWASRHESLYDAGVGCFKLDDGDITPPNDRIGFYNGMSGKEMNNLYPLLYVRSVYEGMEKYTGQRAFVWARTAYAGSQRYPAVWSGDTLSTWEFLRAQIRGGQCCGLSGLAHWSNDIGGFMGDSSPELWIRWVQFGMFCPLARVHGHGKEPKKRGYFEIYRGYVRLRYQFLPYFYSCAYEAHRTGVPPMRAMVLEFLGYKEARKADLQYMYGPWLLVAPVTDPGGKKEVYLPEGWWVDYWSLRTYRGKRWLFYQAPIDRLPLFIKSGAIIPMAPVNTRLNTSPVDQLILNIFPGEKSRFEVYDDDGESLDYREGGFSLTRVEQSMGKRSISVAIGKPKGKYWRKFSYLLKVNLTKAVSVKKYSVALAKLSSKSELMLSNQGWFYDSEERATWIKIPNAKKAINLKILFK